jgi:hypothetical protein
MSCYVGQIIFRRNANFVKLISPEVIGSLGWGGEGGTISERNDLVVRVCKPVTLPFNKE